MKVNFLLERSILSFHIIYRVSRTAILYMWTAKTYHNMIIVDREIPSPAESMHVNIISFFQLYFDCSNQNYHDQVLLYNISNQVTPKYFWLPPPTAQTAHVFACSLWFWWLLLATDILEKLVQQPPQYRFRWWFIWSSKIEGSIWATKKKQRPYFPWNIVCLIGNPYIIG